MILALFGTASAQAARVQNLYSAELMVAQQTMQVSPDLGGQALAQVLVKVSGRPQVLETEPVRTALASPNRFVQQFSYQSAGQMLTNDDGVEVPAQILRLDFIPALVDQLLQQAGFRPLGAVRPGVLVWIVEERGQQREFLGREEDPVLAPMRERARERGLPLFRPLLDLEDQAALSVSDAWGFFAEPVTKASSRYQADAVLVGRLFPRGGGWQSRWMLLHGDERVLFDGQGDSLGEHLGGAVDQTADRVFADYVVTVADDGGDGVLVEVGGVSQFDHFAPVVDALREMTVVRSVQLLEQNHEVLTLKLQLNGSLDQLKRAIALNNRFSAQEGPLQPLSQAQLYYRWGG
nr:DUF2066 domain-containing protein [Motiliproteus sediminis]